jgi:hypothetical protein
MQASIYRFFPLAFAALVTGASLPRAARAQGDAPPVLAGRVIPAGGGDVRGVRVFARVGDRADSAGVDSTGRFSLALSGPPITDSLEVWVEAAGAFHPARLRLSPEVIGREHEIVLVPLRWTIHAGRYAGREVEVRLARAFSPPCATCTGFFRAMAAPGDSARTRLQGWPAERFPLRVAFDREWNGETVTARDSAAFWRETAELEETFGADVFRPANFPDTTPREDGGPDDVILVWFDPDMGGLGGIGTAVSTGDEIEYGDLRLNRQALREQALAPGLVAHELMHTLGFGHTCAWRSVVADVRRCPSLRAPGVTEDDVAYVELAAEIRSLLREHGGRWAVEAATAAMSAPGRFGRGAAPDPDPASAERER